MISGGKRHDGGYGPGLELGFQLVVRAPELEGARALEVLRLEVDRRARGLVELPGAQNGRADRDAGEPAAGGLDPLPRQPGLLRLLGLFLRQSAHRATTSCAQIPSRHSRIAASARSTMRRRRSA